MAGTTVYPAKVNLLAMLEAWAWPDGKPAITWGSPTEAEDVTFDAIYLGGVDIADDFRVLGASRSDETYALPIVIDIRRYGDDEQDTEKRAWDLHNQVLTLVRADMTLGGAISHITGYRVRQPPSSIPSPDQWRTQIVIEMTCAGHIFY